MHWRFVENIVDTAELLRGDDEPLTSPRYNDLDEDAQRQAKLVHKAIRGLVKAGVVGEGQIVVNAAGKTITGDEKMPRDDPNFIAISIGRRP